MSIKKTPVHEDDTDHVYVDVHLLLVLLVSREMEVMSIIQHHSHQQRKIQLECHWIRGKKRLVASYQQSLNTSNHDLGIQ